MHTYIVQLMNLCDALAARTGMSLHVHVLATTIGGSQSARSPPPSSAAGRRRRSSPTGGHHRTGAAAAAETTLEADRTAANRRVKHDVRNENATSVVVDNKRVSSAVADVNDQIFAQVLCLVYGYFTDCYR